MLAKRGGRGFDCRSMAVSQLECSRSRTALANSTAGCFDRSERSRVVDVVLTCSAESPRWRSAAIARGDEDFA